MKKSKILGILICVLVVCSAFTMRRGSSPVYMFGVSASFSDSLVYISDIQPVEGAVIDKNGFLELRNQYAYQMEHYLSETQKAKNPTCVIFFSKSQKDLIKQSDKMLEKYRADHTNVIRTLDATIFKFTKPEIIE